MQQTSNVVGTCSLCGGDVIDVDLSPCGRIRKLIGRPNGRVYKCVSCGAHPRPVKRVLPVIEMEEV